MLSRAARRAVARRQVLRCGPCGQQRGWRWVSSSSSSSSSPSDEAQLLEALRSCDEIYRRDVAPINEALHGPLEHAYQPTMLPFVLLLGNHSSGKSSFANFALGRDVQTAGVAPTDDSFTIIAPGASDADQDGPALVSDPDLGFQGLRTFGPGLVQHTQLKIRSGIRSSNFMLVDSPGMIDSPGGPLSGGGKLERGYHFENAVKWFADRADVVLLFFDPDKPGTGQEKGDSTSLQRGCSRSDSQGETIYALSSSREMIARLKMSQIEWKTIEI